MNKIAKFVCVLILICMIYVQNSDRKKIIYYRKSFILLLILLTSCVVSFFSAPFVYLIYGEKDMHLVNYVTSHVFSLGTRYALGISSSFEGLEYIKEHDDSIIITNHQCVLDLIPVCVPLIHLLHKFTIILIIFDKTGAIYQWLLKTLL